jgi:hypothetical protein
MALELKSKDELREYVEAELDRSVRKEHPDLLIEFVDAVTDEMPQDLCWYIIRPEGRIGRNESYTVEARPDRKEFLVWYGVQAGGAAWSSPALSRCVHVHFPDALPATVSSRLRSELSLGAALQTMLGDEELYPMNCFALT